MEWVTDIFEESVSKDTLHAFCGIHEEHPTHQTTPSTSIEDNGSDIDNNEDVDRAIAISLSEEIQRKEIEKEAQLKEDELLARAIQQSLNLEGSSDCETEHDSPDFEDCHSNHEGDEDSMPAEEIEDSIPAEEIKDSIPAEVRAKKVPAEVRATIIPGEVWAKKVPAEEIKDSIPSEVRGKRALQEVRAKNVPAEVQAKKVSAEEIKYSIPSEVRGKRVLQDVRAKNVPAEVQAKKVLAEEIKYSIPSEVRGKRVLQEVQAKIVPAEVWAKNVREEVQAKNVAAAKKAPAEEIKDSIPAEVRAKRVLAEDRAKKVTAEVRVKNVPAEVHAKKVPAEEIKEIKHPVPPPEIEINPRRNHQNVDQRPYYNIDTECDVCMYYIPKNPYGHLEYRSHPFWLQKYCPSHEHDGTPRCCSCERMKSYDSIFIGLDDGRKLCLECHDSAIMDTDGCQPLYLEIKKFYESLGMKLEQQVPLLLVERQALNEAREGEKDGHHNMPETRGICLSEEQSSGLIPRRPKTKGGQSSDNNKNIETEPQKIRRHCEVTAILILHGLPRLLTGTILSHELMHAWLRLQGYPTLRAEVEEGICQVMALMWLEIELRRESVDFSGEKKFGEFLKQSIVADASPAYGDGFRLGWQAARKFGLHRTLDHIRKTGNFPH